MDFTAEYERLISNQRPASSTSPQSNTISGAAASDRSRILYSAPFRRLQMKAQVFPLEDNAAVRSRLTHSLEVSDIGRSIARKLAMDPLRSFLDSERASAFVDVVETACLMHDIGNPPFGHFGEEAIQRWFRTHGERVYRQSTGDENWNQLQQEEGADFLYFDGNPQGLRIVSQLQYGLRPGMNLTYTQLLAGIKYPYSAKEAMSGKRKKAGFFVTESENVEQAQSALGVATNARHPLSYIMEAADDIAYCMSDIEDGFEKELIDLNVLSGELRSAWADTRLVDLIPQKWAENWADKTGEFLKFKTQYALRMVDFAVEKYLSSHQGIVAGTCTELFPEGSEEHRILRSLKRLARKELFRNEEVENLELAGFSIISGLLEHYGKLLELTRENFLFLVNEDWQGKQLDVEWRLYNRLPRKHLHLYKHVCGTKVNGALSKRQEWCMRAHLITDYISGMTDRFALSTFQRLGGMRIA